jgi:hypothetical protein
MVNFNKNMINNFLQQHKINVLSLVIFAIVSGIVWRVEVEMQGWEGLKWITYTHWAIPIGVILFAIWLGTFSAIPVVKIRFWLASLFLVVAILLYFLLHISFSYFFITGPSAFVSTASIGTIPFFLLRFSILFIYPAVLVLAWIAAKRCSLLLNWQYLALSAFFFIGAFPFAMLAIAMLERNIDASAIHAIKTGWVFPFMMIGLGIPFLSPQRVGN